MPKRTSPLFVVLCVAAIGAACGGSGTSDKSASANAPASAATSAGKKVDAATAATVSGVVTFDGAAPPNDVIRMSADKKCADEKGPAKQNEVLLVSDKHVRNVFVYVKDGLDPQYSFESPTTPVVLDQKGCVYWPRVLGMRTGQGIQIANSDPTMHNVHALPMVNREFNHGQPKQGGKTNENFTAPEVMVRFKCDVHAWMIAWVGVLPHPYYAVSDADGAFKITGLPPGTYTLEAWHEKLGTKTTKITVGPSQSENVSFAFTNAGK